MESFFTKVKVFRFWPKTMDYNKAFWPKSRSFFVVLLLENGRCYEAEISDFFPMESLFLFFGRTIDSYSRKSMKCLMDCLCLCPELDDQDRYAY